MSKKSKKIIAGLVAVALLITACITLPILLKEPKPVESEIAPIIPTEVINLYKNKVENISYIDVSNTEYAFKLEKLTENTFRIKELEGLPVKSGEMNYMAAFICDINAEKKVLDATDRPEDFGLTQTTRNAYVTAVFNDGSEISLTIGKILASNNNYYCSISGDTSVYEISIGTIERFLNEKNDFIDKLLIMAEDTETDIYIDKFTLSGSSRKIPIVLATRETEPPYIGIAKDFSMTSPFVKDLDENKWNTCKNNIFGLSGEEIVKLFPTKADLTSYGLDKPVSILSYEKDGLSNTIKLGSLHENSYYIQKNDDNVVFKISKTAVSWAETQAMDIISRFIVLHEIAKVKELVIETGSTTLNCDLRFGDNETQAVTINGQKRDIDVFKSYYQLLIGTPAFNQNTVPKTGNPIYKVKIVLRDGTESVVEYYKTDLLRYGAQLNGELVFDVKSSYIDHLIEQIPNLLADKKIISIF